MCAQILDSGGGGASGRELLPWQVWREGGVGVWQYQYQGDGCV